MSSSDSKAAQRAALERLVAGYDGPIVRDAAGSEWYVRGVGRGGWYRALAFAVMCRRCAAKMLPWWVRS
jgi:hypothetical protein